MMNVTSLNNDVNIYRTHVCEMVDIVQVITVKILTIAIVMIITLFIVYPYEPSRLFIRENIFVLQTAVTSEL